MPGTVQITPTDSGGTAPFEADNTIYEIDSYVEKMGHEIENADVPPEVETVARTGKPLVGGHLRQRSLLCCCVDD